MPDPDRRPKPDTSDGQPTPDQPKDPSVYGGQWSPGGDKPADPTTPDRPEPIKAPAESQ